jgi:hypothetical protein
MKTYSRHNCDRHHRTAATFIKCAIRPLAWVEGNGNYAFITWCRIPAVSLWPTAEAAHAAAERTQVCGGMCVRNHDVVYIDLDGQ